MPGRSTSHACATPLLLRGSVISIPVLYMQFDDPDFRGGANVLSLNEARALRQQCVMLRKLESMAASVGPLPT